jgi:hypothetical protein
MSPRAGATRKSETTGSMPNDTNSWYAKNAPTMKNSPWAKLTMPITPMASARPTETSA